MLAGAAVELSTAGHARGAGAEQLRPLPLRGLGTLLLRAGDALETGSHRSPHPLLPEVNVTLRTRSVMAALPPAVDCLDFLK